MFGKEDGKVEELRINYYYALIIKSRRMESRDNFPFFFSTTFSLLFFTQFGRKKTDEPRWKNPSTPFSFLSFFHSNQTIENHIFLSFYLPPLSILPLFTPTKHSISAYILFSWTKSFTRICSLKCGHFGPSFTNPCPFFTTSGVQ